MSSSFEKSVDDIRRAIVREHRAGVDVGELLVHAVTAANYQLADQDGMYVTSNRPGSWEAALVEPMIQQFMEYRKLGQKEDKL